jgi:hypothetical protein
VKASSESSRNGFRAKPPLALNIAACPEVQLLLIIDDPE